MKSIFLGEHDLMCFQVDKCNISQSINIWSLNSLEEKPF